MNAKSTIQPQMEADRRGSGRWTKQRFVLSLASWPLTLSTSVSEAKSAPRVSQLPSQLSAYICVHLRLRLVFFASIRAHSRSQFVV
jgi:hypothetical protein